MLNQDKKVSFGKAKNLNQEEETIKETLTWLETDRTIEEYTEKQKEVDRYQGYRRISHVNNVD